ncbi:DUF3649 domain-containing protein [Streptomyces sp. NPDC021218]
MTATRNTSRAWLGVMVA